jgi:hypothetical protein
MGPLDVEFGDLDGNGYMDVLFACETTPSYIFLADTNGQISSSLEWQSAEGDTYLNSVDIGLTFLYNIPYAVMTGNNQLSGDGRIRQYLFGQPFPETSNAYWLSDTVGFGSGILIADVTRDQIPDLIYGGWWLPVEVLEGDGTSFNTTPVYTSLMTSVVETIQMADLGKETLVQARDEFSISYRQCVLYLSHQVIDEITGVIKNGVLLEGTDFIYVPNKNWLSFTEPLLPGDLIAIDYLYCHDGDLIITNWDSDKGNFIYYNHSSPVTIADRFQGSGSQVIGIFPQPVINTLNVTVHLSRESECLLVIYRISGNEMKAAGPYGLSEGSNTLTIDVSVLPAGIYFLKIDLNNEQFIRKFVKS